MRKLTTMIVGTVAAVGLLVGCQDRTEQPAGTGGAGYEQKDDARLGDGKIGEKEGVVDDGEGPLEGDGKADDKIGDRPGVINDGEGPIEENVQEEEMKDDVRDQTR